MLKRIEKDCIRVGMFIEDVVGAWQDNPFQSRRFKLDNIADVTAIKKSRLSAVIINTTLGVDVDQRARGSEVPNHAGAKSYPEAIFGKKRYAVASGILSETETAVECLFTQVRQDESVDLTECAPVVSQIMEVMDEEPYVFLVLTRLKSKDTMTFVHSIAVSALMARFGMHLRFDREMTSLLAMAGLLHDIGKMKTPQDILTKAGKLTEQEFAVIREHPVQGHAILTRSAGASPIMLDICLHHHEQLDGSGYPDGLSGNEISLPARIAAICDVYEAITSVRPYKNAWSHSDALAWMSNREGHFDRALLHEFIVSLQKIAAKRP